MKCGNCKNDHPTANDVRLCYLHDARINADNKTERMKERALIRAEQARKAELAHPSTQRTKLTETVKAGLEATRERHKHDRFALRPGEKLFGPEDMTLRKEKP